MNKEQQSWPEVKVEIWEGQYLGTTENSSFIIDRLFPLENENYDDWARS